MSAIMHDSQTITLPTRHPKWCMVDSHQGLLDDLDGPFDEKEVNRVRMHWAMGGEHARISVVELRAGHDDHSQKSVLDEGGYWSITLEQQPDIDDLDGGHGQHFISLYTMGGADSLTITSGEARVLAAHLLAAADKIDLS
jgi:hypothetical protein